MIKRKAVAAASPLTADGIAEWVLCSPARGVAGFERFCTQWLTVWDKDRKQWVAFTWWAGQRQAAELLCLGFWLILLKGRQIGLTTLMRAYVLWRMTYEPVFVAGAIFQTLHYAHAFKKQLTLLWRRLPAWMRHTATIDDKRTLEFGVQPQNSVVECLAANQSAGRSLTPDFVLIDEASYVDGLRSTYEAVTPGLIGGGGSNTGQLVLVTTSAGPSGDYAELWQETYGQAGELLDERGVGPTRLRPVFFGWDARPDRGPAFYEGEKRRLSTKGPSAFKREYPRTIQEAFEHAAGRVYPLFGSEVHVGSLDLESEELKGCERYRAIDWGETRSAYVCLWVAHIPGPPGFLVHPECVNTIREFLSYRLEEDPPYRPLKQDDHTCDAVRYLVTTCRLKGLVYVYREVYRKELLEAGFTLPKLIDEIHERSGWQASMTDGRVRYKRVKGGEKFRETVADRAQGLAIATLCGAQIPTRGAARIAKPKDSQTGGHWDELHYEVLEGINQVSALIDGTMDLGERMAVTRVEQAAAVYRQSREAQARVPHGVSLERHMMIEAARRLLRGKR